MKQSLYFIRSISIWYGVAVFIITLFNLLCGSLAQNNVFLLILLGYIIAIFFIDTAIAHLSFKWHFPYVLLDILIMLPLTFVFLCFTGWMTPTLGSLITCTLEFLLIYFIIRVYSIHNAREQAERINRALLAKRVSDGLDSVKPNAPSQTR